MQYATSTPLKLYGYQPQPDTWTFRRHLTHIFESEQMIWRRFLELEARLKPDDLELSSKNEVVEYAEHITSETRNLMLELSDEQWKGLYPTLSGKHIPFFEMLLQQLDHEAHHRGQLTQYLRQNGRVPPEF